jgi:class 3 adenylate cyclase
VERRLRWGPVAAIPNKFAIAGAGDRREIGVRLTMQPRLFFLRPILRLRASTSAKRIAREFARIDASLAAGADPCRERPVKLARDAFERVAAAFRGDADPAIAARILEWVSTAEDVDVAKMRPFELADGWNLERTDVLAAFLRGVRAGLLELSWDVVCPSCRVASSSIPSLDGLEEHARCQVCELEFAVDLDTAVEATFSPPDAIRALDRGPYCSGGPARTPHVLAQSIVPAGGSSALRAPAEPGTYRLFVRGGGAASLEVLDGAAREATLALTGGSELAPKRATVAPRGDVSIANASPRELHAKIERVDWARKAATAKDVTSLAAFRDQFAADTLKPGLSLKISRVAILFSDLVGSTQLYSDVGDGKAFRLVLDHFDLVGEIIAKRRGTIVKTIGDAVMAVFADEIDGALAAIDIALAFGPFREATDVRRRTDIKLGLYAGSCYAITANGVLDYFGQTVNVAARLQGEAKSGEVVVERRLAAALRDRGALPPGSSVVDYDAALKGLDRPLPAARIQLSRAPAR